MRVWIDVEPGEYDKHSLEVKLLRHDRSALREKTEQLNSKFWHRCLPHNSSLLRIGQFEHGLKINKEEEVLRRDISIAWILSQPSLFFTEQFKAILEEIKLMQHCKTTCCYRATSPSTPPRWKLPRHALHHHPIGIDSGWKRRQERETDDSLHSRESYARTSTQAAG